MVGDVPATVAATATFDHGHSNCHRRNATPPSQSQKWKK